MLVLGVIFFSFCSSSGLALVLFLRKPPPGPAKPQGKLVRVENVTRVISGGSLNECRDYRVYVFFSFRSEICVGFLSCSWPGPGPGRGRVA